MKFSKLVIVILFSFLSILTSCGDSSTKSVETANNALFEINDFEQKLEDEAYIRFERYSEATRNDVFKTNIAIIYFGDQSNTDQLIKSKELLAEYVNLVSKFLNDYPENDFFISSREELKTKVKLSRDTINKIDSLI